MSTTGSRRAISPLSSGTNPVVRPRSRCSTSPGITIRDAELPVAVGRRRRRHRSDHFLTWPLTASSGVILCHSVTLGQISLELVQTVVPAARIPHHGRGRTDQQRNDNGRYDCVQHVFHLPEIPNRWRGLLRILNAHSLFHAARIVDRDPPHGMRRTHHPPGIGRDSHRKRMRTDSRKRHREPLASPTLIPVPVAPGHAARDRYAQADRDRWW